MNNLRFFFKGVHVMFDIFLLTLVWALLERNERFENELADFKKIPGFDQYRKSYSTYQKYQKPKSMPTEKPNNPIGFA